MTVAQALRPPSRTLLLLEGRAVQELGAFMLLRPWLAAAPRGDGHPVLVFPGLLASDLSTQPLRGFLKQHGYAVHGWKQGRNLGLRAGVEADMLDRIEELYERHGKRKLSLVGWSLGGIYARQLAKRVPDKVRSVISLGSPFTGSPKATNAWKVYEFASGQRVDDRDHHIAGPGVGSAAGADHVDLQPFRRHLRLADLPQRGRAAGREHRGLRQPLRARPSSGRGVCRRRPAGAARGPVDEVRPLGLEEPGLSRLASLLRERGPPGPLMIFVFAGSAPLERA